MYYKRSYIVLSIIILILISSFIVGIILYNNCVPCNFKWNHNTQQFGCVNGKIIQANAINYYCETGIYCINSVENMFCWRCSVIMQYQNMNNISCIISETGYDQNKLIDKLKTKFPKNITNIFYFNDDDISKCSIDNSFPLSTSCYIGILLLMFSGIEFIAIIIIFVMYYKKIKTDKNIKNLNNQQIEFVDTKINLENINESDKKIRTDKNIKNINNQQIELVDTKINLENINESDKIIEEWLEYVE